MRDPTERRGASQIHWQIPRLPLAIRGSVTMKRSNIGSGPEVPSILQMIPCRVMPAREEGGGFPMVDMGKWRQRWSLTYRNGQPAIEAHAVAGGQPSLRTTAAQ